MVQCDKWLCRAEQRRREKCQVNIIDLYVKPARWIETKQCFRQVNLHLTSAQLFLFTFRLPQHHHSIQFGKWTPIYF